MALRQAGTREETIQASEADVTEAQTVLMQRYMELEDTELRAPFAGTIASLDLDIGEQVAAGTPVARLADQSEWHVETDDLTETDVVQVAVGQPVKVTVDAIPDQEFDGVVTEVAPRSETKRGDVTYTVTIELTDSDDLLVRWGMTVFTDIDVD